MEFDDDKIFIEYAVWIYHLLCDLIKNLSHERIRDQMVSHYRILDAALSEILPADEAQKASHHLANAITATENECANYIRPDRFERAKFPEIRKEYLARLLKNDTRGAIRIIEMASQSGIPLEDIYLNILQEVMYEVGNLWHQNAIPIDKEHYCTSTTQMALSQFYPQIFAKPRNKFKILTCCVGSELHEMGIRMVSDLFEYYGWESIYLGAAVPKEAVLGAIKEHQPDLVALSVTMPLHLTLCLEIVQAIRAAYPSVKIAVGGRAFQTTDELWKKWDVDVSTENAAQLIEWAERAIVNSAGGIT